jgi:hypothetical protein
MNAETRRCVDGYMKSTEGKGADDTLIITHRTSLVTSNQELQGRAYTIRQERGFSQRSQHRVDGWRRFKGFGFSGLHARRSFWFCAFAYLASSRTPCYAMPERLDHCVTTEERREDVDRAGRHFCSWPWMAMHFSFQPLRLWITLIEWVTCESRVIYQSRKEKM